MRLVRLFSPWLLQGLAGAVRALGWAGSTGTGGVYPPGASRDHRARFRGACAPSTGTE